MNESPFNAKLNKKRHHFDMFLLVILIILGVSVVGISLFQIGGAI